jgi:hypothetical protein
VRGMTHHSPDQRDDAVGPAIASSSGAALS